MPPPGLAVGPGEYIVLAQTAEGSREVPGGAAYLYGNQVRFTNETGSIVLTFGGAEIDRVDYDSSRFWPIREGRTMSLHPGLDAAANDDPLNWYYARTPLAASLAGTPGAPNDEVPMFAPNAPLVDDVSVFDLDRVAPIVMEVTVDADDLATLHADPHADVAFPANLAVPDEGFGTGGRGANATIAIRGARSRTAQQLSFKVRLIGPRYGEQREIHLNKHPFDPTRFRNHAAYTLLRGLDNMVSLRTQFVHLFINGQDFGLFTQIEHIRDRFLRLHGLDDRGTLIKANWDFRFRPPLDRERAGGLLEGTELKAGERSDGLFAMLDGIHDEQDFAVAFDRHFNRENFLTYYAVSYLLPHIDSSMGNFLLYATPRDPDRFYLIPFDLDESLDLHRNSAQWKQGLWNFGQQSAFREFVKDPQNLDDLLTRIDEIAVAHFAPRATTPVVDALNSVVVPFLSRSPDSSNLPPSARRDRRVLAMPTVPEVRAQQLVASLDAPMPVRTYRAEVDRHGRYVFRWDESFDFQGDSITYEILFSETPSFELGDVVLRLSDPAWNTMTSTTPLDSTDLRGLDGSYFWTVMVHDNGTPGSTQVAFGVRTPKNAVIPLSRAFGDWTRVPIALKDADDIADSSGPDFLDVQVSNDRTNLLLRYTSANAFSLSELFARSQVFLDVDNDATTGFPINGIGSDLLVEGDGLFLQESGTFNAGFLGRIPTLSRFDAPTFQVALPLNEIYGIAPGASDVRIVLQNAEAGDLAPDTGAIHYTLLR